MKCIVAVSGGVDSVVLLDMLASMRSAVADVSPLIVAHVNHGIRPESADDARFVRALASQYGLLYLQTELQLGADASEDTARRGRYDWLLAQAKEYKAIVMTAHHADDMVGSIAINLLRGTGWRGLAVMRRQGIERPLLALNKAQIYEYALEHRLEWVEDTTNRSSRYLRNRLRAGVVSLPQSTYGKLAALHKVQVQLAHDIDQQVLHIGQTFGDKRYPYTMIPTKVAVELLRQRWAITRPTAERLLYAIKTARPGTQQTIGDGLTARYTKDDFCIS